MAEFLKVIFVVVVLYVVAVLGLTLAEVLGSPDPQEGLLQLVETLFSWQVIGGSAAVAGGHYFRESIRGFLTK